MNLNRLQPHHGQFLRKRSKNRGKINFGSLASGALILLLSLFFCLSIQVQNLLNQRKNHVAPIHDNKKLRAQKISQFTVTNEIANAPYVYQGYPVSKKFKPRKMINYYYERRIAAHRIWDAILEFGYSEMEEAGFKEHFNVFEVGAFSAKQILTAATKKFHVFFFEPSPTNFERIHNIALEEKKKDPSIEEFLHPFQMAAGVATGDTLEFKFSGSSGDHVGNFDIWNMKAGEDSSEIPEEKRAKVTKVQSVKLDDVMDNKFTQSTKFPGLELGENLPQVKEVFAVKIDTQGYEPRVLEGLKKSIADHKIRYILLEYWPKGIDLINNSSEQCKLPVDMLLSLQAAGYHLLSLPIEVHPSALTNELNKYLVEHGKERPFRVKDDCDFLRSLEQKFPNESYHMGYWTDILAVSPGNEIYFPSLSGIFKKKFFRDDQE